MLWLFACWHLGVFCILGLLFLKALCGNFGLEGCGRVAEGQKSAGAPFSTRDLSSAEKCLHLSAGCQSSATLAASIC